MEKKVICIERTCEHQTCLYSRQCKPIARIIGHHFAEPFKDPIVGQSGRLKAKFRWRKIPEVCQVAPQPRNILNTKYEHLRRLVRDGIASFTKTLDMDVNMVAIHRNRLLPWLGCHKRLAFNNSLQVAHDERLRERPLTEPAFYLVGP